MFQSVYACIHEIGACGMRVGGGGGVTVRPSCVCAHICACGIWARGGRAETRREKVQQEKGGSCRSGFIYRSVVKRSHLRGMRPFLHCDRRGACLKSKRQL